MPSVGTGRDARQPQADRHRRQRRRRHRRDRHRPVRAPDAPQPADHLHHRGQRLLRADEGAVLADRRLGSKAKNGIANELPPIDTCALAIELGASFVARSFSGDKKQLLSILKASLSHQGTCMIDVLSPCVTFNDHEGSTKSYAYAKDHDEAARRGQLRAVLRGHQRRVRAGHDDGGVRCTTGRSCI